MNFGKVNVFTDSLTNRHATIMMKNFLTAVGIGFTLLLGANSAQAVPLYDGFSLPSQTPVQQGWLYQYTAFPTAPSATATSGGTILNTGHNSNYAGYFKQSPVVLDRNTGYTISFNVQINSESHSSNDRAGFSIIVISDSLAGETQPYGIELGFWQNSIWAQNVGFKRGETANLDTKSRVNNYTLYVKGNQYQLFVNGSTNPILKGYLRQYTGYTPPPGYQNPYKASRTMFMGDNTTSATSKVTITKVYVTSGS